MMKGACPFRLARHVARIQIAENQMEGLRTEIPRQCVQNRARQRAIGELRAGVQISPEPVRNGHAVVVQENQKLRKGHARGCIARRARAPSLQPQRPKHKPFPIRPQPVLKRRDRAVIHHNDFERSAGSVQIA